MTKQTGFVPGQCVVASVAHQPKVFKVAARTSFLNLLDVHLAQVVDQTDCILVVLVFLARAMAGFAAKAEFIDQK